VSDLVASCHPAWSIPGGDVDLSGLDVRLGADGPPRLLVGHEPARVRSASRHQMRFTVPQVGSAGVLPVFIDPQPEPVAHLTVGHALATGLHMVDSPAFDGLGRLYVTESGSRGVKVPVPLFRVRPDGGRDPVAVELPNPTAVALGPDGALYVSSRFEGQVYRLTAADRVEVFCADLGVPTGLAFDAEGSLFVGDRSGSIFRVSQDKQVDTFASLPSSVAAFHLAFGPDGWLYATAPTLSSHDVLYRISPDRLVDVVCGGFGRPQGLAFDSDGRLYVADALAGASGLYRIDITQSQPTPELLVSTPAIVGIAFDPAGAMVLASSDTVWRIDAPLRPFLAWQSRR
jgi:sugar lactone lactonase YvrE